MENGEQVKLPGFKPVSQFKRNTVRAGGVAIYENEDAAPAFQSTDRELLEYDRKYASKEDAYRARWSRRYLLRRDNKKRSTSAATVCVHYARYSDA